MLEQRRIRIYLSGRMSVEADGVMHGPDSFPAQQGRVCFAVLVAERGPVARTALAETLWPQGPPAAWETALSAIVSKLRALLNHAGLDGAGSLVTRDGCHELRLPPGTWIDHEAAADAIHEAEAALRAGEPARAYGPSAVAHHIARRPFLAGESSHWVEQRRQKLSSVLVRALECRAEVYLWNREHSLAVEAARDAVALEPFRETAYQLLMRAHAAGGNTAEAMRVYDACRTLLSAELGVAPSPQTRALHAELLASL